MPSETTLRERLSQGKPDLIADLYLYATGDGGKAKPISIGYGCSCSKDKTLTEGWDGYPILDAEMAPGERRRVGFVFLSGPEAVEALNTAEPSFLWEGKFIGEARIVR